MMPNITKGAKPVGLMAYLFGPGRSNEHENPHAVAGSASMMIFAPSAGDVVTMEQAAMLGRELDRARRVHGVDTFVTATGQARELRDSGAVATASAAVASATSEQNVWHCSLSLHPDETPLSDERWADISHRFMEVMGYHSPEGDGVGVAWLAVRHGLSGTPDSATRNDHIHIAASTVTDDGSRIDTRRDYRRAQDAAAQIETEFGLRITTGRAERTTSKGTAPGQEHVSARTARGEPVRDELARTVRAVAAASESEAEFVRLTRAHGLLIRPRWSDGARTSVTGFSVALPTETYATRTGAPVWHGGGKLGNDLSLPRLREGWLTDAGAQADAVSAWSHNQRETIDPSAVKPTPQRARPRNDLTVEQARDRLRATVMDAARTSRSEASFVGAVFSHPDLLIRPRFAEGSRVEVTGYSVALQPGLYARADGGPQWHGAGKLDNALNLARLREHWGPPRDSAVTAAEWARAAGKNPPHRDQWADVGDATQRWARKVSSVSPAASEAAWATAAGDTAAAVSAWSLRAADSAHNRELRQLSRALAEASGHQRSPRQAGVQRASAARRAASMILAASHDDPRMAYMVMFAQIAAAAQAVADAAEARGHAQRAIAIRQALDATQAQYAALTPDQRVAEYRAARPEQHTAASMTQHQRGRGDGMER